MKRIPATPERAMRGSLGCALSGVESDGQLGMPATWLADGHVRLPFGSNLYISRGSAVV